MDQKKSLLLQRYWPPHSSAKSFSYEKKTLFFNYFWQHLVKRIYKDSLNEVSVQDDNFFLYKTTVKSLFCPTQHFSDTTFLPTDFSRLQIQTCYPWFKVKSLIHNFICFISYSLLLSTDRHICLDIPASSQKRFPVFSNWKSETTGKHMLEGTSGGQLVPLPA